jgi:hypothetical protein
MTDSTHSEWSEYYIITSDREALVDLYHRLSGCFWSRQSQWLTDTAIETWEGVTVDGSTGRVISLDLKQNNLAGPLPSSITQLSELQRLYLHDNKITGNINIVIVIISNY